jgi:hypothetical protein
VGFDIFRRVEDASPLWVAQVNSLGEVRARLAALRHRSPGQYFVRDAETGQFIAAEESENPQGNVKSSHKTAQKMAF